MHYIWISWEEFLFQKLLPQESGIIFSRTRILTSRQCSREFYWKGCVIANLMNRIAISKTLALRIGNSFLENENSFWQVMKQTVLQNRDRMFNCKSYNQNRNFRNSCHENRDYFFSRTRILFSRQWRRRFFWKECSIANLMKRIAISKLVR